MAIDPNQLFGKLLGWLFRAKQSLFDADLVASELGGSPADVDKALQSLVKQGRLEAHGDGFSLPGAVLGGGPAKSAAPAKASAPTAVAEPAARGGGGRGDRDDRGDRGAARNGDRDRAPERAERGGDRAEATTRNDDRGDRGPRDRADDRGGRGDDRGARSDRDDRGARGGDDRGDRGGRDRQAAPEDRGGRGGQGGRGGGGRDGGRSQREPEPAPAPAPPSEPLECPTNPPIHTWLIDVSDALIDFVQETQRPEVTVDDLEAFAGQDFADTYPTEDNVRGRIFQILEFLATKGIVESAGVEGAYRAHSTLVEREQSVASKLDRMDIRRATKREYTIECAVPYTGLKGLAVLLYSGKSFLGEELTFPTPEGTDYIEVHHIHRIAQGGNESLENLALLNPFHHKMCHFASEETMAKMQTQLSSLMKERLDAMLASTGGSGTAKRGKKAAAAVKEEAPAKKSAAKKAASKRTGKAPEDNAEAGAAAKATRKAATKTATAKKAPAKKAAAKKAPAKKAAKKSTK